MGYTLWLLLPVLLAGCAGRQIPFQAPPATELAAVPFYPQEKYQCGPAALATVLGWSGADVDMASLVDSVYVPGRQGSLQPEMIAAARRAGRIPFPVPPAPAAIGAELAAGHPVLVLQNLGLERLPRWHYAVVVGYDPDEEVFILRSGVEKTRSETVQRFMSSWQRGEYWGVVVLRPGQLPASQPAPAPVARAVANAEGLLTAEAAASAWEGLLARWPDDPDVLFGAANARRRAGETIDAGRTYHRLLQSHPQHIAARNNLADLLLQAGCPELAAEQLNEVRTSAPTPTLADIVDRTRRDIEVARGRPHGDIPACARWRGIAGPPSRTMQGN